MNQNRRANGQNDEGNVVPDVSRRKFISKAIAGAGATAVTALATG